MPDLNEQFPVAGTELNVQNNDPELDELFSKLEDEYRKFNSNLIVMKNKIEQSRVQILRKALDMLRSSGIDPNNPEQIREFMDKLAQLDPDLLELFEGAMNELLKGEETDLSSIPEEQQISNQVQEEQMPTEQFPNLVQ